MRYVFRAAAILLAAWLGFVVLVYTWMRKPPEDFARRMAAMPGPAMMLFPFETLWTKARQGSLSVGDPAPDFELPAADGSGRVRLADYRGSRPVVLVFGSYT